MKIKYFEETDTALFELGGGPVAATRELSEDIYVDVDASGRVVAITLEHASERADWSELSFERVAKNGHGPDAGR